MADPARVPREMELRNLGQPQQQMLVVENADGAKVAFPFVAVATLSDAALQMIITSVTAAIFAELERRELVAPAPIVDLLPQPPTEEKA